MFSSNNSQVSNDANYIESCFSTYLYTGNGSTQTITNGIDLAGEGGLVWIKRRDSSGNNWVGDTVRGRSKLLITNSTGAEQTSTVGSDITSFNSNGFSLGPEWVAPLNTNAATYASWTFRKQPKFFDVVTWTGNSVSNRAIGHSLDSTVGSIIVKCTNSAEQWVVWHRSTGVGKYLVLNETNPVDDDLYSFFGSSAPTSTNFYVGTNSRTNETGRTYVAYLFAHDAGGFGLSGEDNVISCGSYTGTGADLSVNLSYEPQFIIIKNSTNAFNWQMHDNMRGVPTDGNDARLHPNLSNAEATDANWIDFNATGFTVKGGLGGNLNASGHGYIYIAIRRGPMKVPESGTSVFAPVAYTGNGSTQIATTGFPVDAMIEFERTNSSGVPAAGGKYMTDRLRGSSAYLETSSAGAEGTGFVFGLANNTGVNLSSYFNSSSRTYIIEAFRRAPGFFDVVCYTGTGVARTVAHNLGVAPELTIIKSRSLGVENWNVWQKDLGTQSPGYYYYLQLNETNGRQASNDRVSTVTSTVVNMGDNDEVNKSASTYVMYLFASAPGVSKVFSFTGNGSSQTINCGFTGGARFVMIKRTDSTGDWYVWDSARGIVSGNDPHLSLNSTAAEVTTDDSVDTDSTGFIVNQLSATNINVSSATYIGIAIA